MPYSLNSSREERLAKASAQNSNDDEGNISDFSDYPSNGARVPDLSGRKKLSQSASTIRSVFERFHLETSVDDRPETRLGGNARTLRPSPKMIGNPVKVPVRVRHPIPPLVPISSNDDDGHYEDMEGGDEEGEGEEEEEEEEEKEEEEEEEDKVIEINEARKVMLHRVQQGSRAIRIMEMLRHGPVHAHVVPPPRSDSFNMIHTISNLQGSQPLDQDTIFESGLESGLENPLCIKGLSATPLKERNLSSVGKSSVEKSKWPNERGGIWRKPVPNSSDGPNSYFLNRAASVQRRADGGGESPSCSPIAHPKQYASPQKSIGYSRLRAAKVEAQEVNIVPDAVMNYAPGVDFVPSLSRTESEKTITSLRQRVIPEIDELEYVETPVAPNDKLGSWCNPAIHREDGLRSHPTSAQFAAPSTQRAPTVPVWVKLSRPLPPLPSATSS